MADSDDTWYVKLPRMLCYWKNWRGRCRNKDHPDYNMMRLPRCNDKCPIRLKLDHKK